MGPPAALGLAAREVPLLRKNVERRMQFPERSFVLQFISFHLYHNLFQCNSVYTNSFQVMLSYLILPRVKFMLCK